MEYFIDTFCIKPGARDGGVIVNDLACFLMEGICKEMRGKLQTNARFHVYMLTFDRAVKQMRDPFLKKDPFVLLGGDPNCFGCKPNTTTLAPEMARVFEAGYIQYVGPKKRMEWAVEWVKGMKQPVPTDGNAWDETHVKRRMIQMGNFENFVKLAAAKKEIADPLNMRATWKGSEVYLTFSAQKHSVKVMKETGYMDREDRLTDKILDGVYDLEAMKLKTHNWIGVGTLTGRRLLQAIQFRYPRLRVAISYPPKTLEMIQGKLGRPFRTIEYRSVKVMQKTASPILQNEYEALMMYRLSNRSTIMAVLRDLVRWFFKQESPPVQDLVGDFMRGKKDFGKGNDAMMLCIEREKTITAWWEAVKNAKTGERAAEKREELERIRMGANHTPNVFILREMGFMTSPEFTYQRLQ
jgi:hypothetical protein